MPTCPALFLSGARSGCGKTTAALALMAAWTSRGLNVRPFKTGPDFLDPALHAAVCGVPSHNLDAWMHRMHRTHRAHPIHQAHPTHQTHHAHRALSLPSGGASPENHTILRAHFARVLQTAPWPDIAVIEGAMGLFDGELSGSSAADVARALNLPVLLVIDARGAGETAAAIAHGLAAFRPDLSVIGAICAFTGSSRHEAILRAAFSAASMPLFGFLPNDPALAVPSRHLGLASPAEALGPERIAALALCAEKHIDLNALLAAAKASAPVVPDTPPLPPPSRRVPIALARDEAFSFWYPEHTALLEAAGADILPFSPLCDSAPPPQARGLILPGGYPELHAERLSANTSMREAIRSFAQTRPVYGECGGYLYLMEHLEKNGRTLPLCGCLPLDARMESTRAALGYREVSGLNGPWRGQNLRGHEFHYSRILHRPSALPALWNARDQNNESAPEGAILGKVFGSYVHLSFLSHPQAASLFVDACTSSV